MNSTRAAERVENDRHSVLFYGSDEPLLAERVSRFLREGLERGESALVIATPAHNTAFAAALRGFPAHRNQSVQYWDAEETLEAISAGGHIDRGRFDAVVAAPLRALGARSSGRIWGYGEMVALLWQRGKRDAAIELDRCWNGVIEGTALRLLCGYPIDVFSSEFCISEIDGIMCQHSSVQSGHPDDKLRAALEAGMTRALGPSTTDVLPLIRPNYRPAWGSMPDAEATILWLRNNLPSYADEIVRFARAHFET